MIPWVHVVIVRPGVGGRDEVEGLRGQHQLRSQLVATATHEEMGKTARFQNAWGQRNGDC